MRHLIDEGRRYEAAGSYDRALSRYQAAEEIANDPAALSEAIRRRSDILRQRSQWHEALQAAGQAEQVATDNGLPDLAAEAINAQGAVYHIRGDLDQAEAIYERAISVSAHARVRGIVLQNFATLAAQRGDLDAAAERFKDAYQSCKEASYERGMLFALMNYARATFDQGRNELAERLLHEAEVLAINMMDLDMSNLASLNRAEALVTRGAYDEAESIVSAALGYYGNTGNPYRRLDALRLLGDISKLRGSTQQARMFYEAAAELARKIEAAAEIELLQKRLTDLDAV